jgi:hypothetical protein
MFEAIEEGIRLTLERDWRLTRQLEEPPEVLVGMPWETMKRYQVWIYCGPTGEMEHDYAQGDPVVGCERATSVITIGLRVRLLDRMENLYSDLRQLTRNVYDVLKEIPSGPPEPITDECGDLWGQSALEGIGAPYALRGLRDGGQKYLWGLRREIAFAVTWEDRWTAGE